MYRDCFGLLTPQVKIRILMSLLHLENRKLDKLEDHFSRLIDMSLSDSDPWVKVSTKITSFTQPLDNPVVGIF